jgi:hypothetical protein
MVIRNRRERLTAVSALQTDEVEAQQGGWDMNISTMWTRPRRLRDAEVVAARHH